MTSRKNETVVKEYTEKLKSITGIVLTDYHGLNVQEMNELRRSLKKNQTEFLVIKNTCGKIAFDNIGIPDFKKYLFGPTGMVIIKMPDPVIPVKKIFEFCNEHQKLKIKAAYLFGEIFDENRIYKIQNLPSREVLLIQAVVSLKMLLIRLIYSLNSPVNKLVYLLNMLSNVKKDIGGK